MRNAGLEETQAGIKIAGRNINNLRYVDDTTLMAESEEELKRLLMKVKVESEKVGLKLNIQKMKIMASGPTTSWQYTALMYTFSYLEPVCCSMSSSNCCFLICIQISQEAGQVIWYSHLFQNFPQFIVIHTGKALA